MRPEFIRHIYWQLNKFYYSIRTQTFTEFCFLLALTLIGIQYFYRQNTRLGISIWQKRQNYYIYYVQIVNTINIEWLKEIKTKVNNISFMNI